MADAGAIRAGKAYVEVGSDQSMLEKGLRDAEAKIRAFGQSIMSIGTKLGAIGAAITSPFIAAAKVFADSGSELHDMSTRTGMSVESLSALGFAAKQSGADLASVEVGVRKMQKAMTAGSLENMQAQATFAQLGLSIRELMALRPDEQFKEISSAIAKIPNPTARAGAAMMIFGKSGTALLPMIEELDTLTGQAKEFGLVMSTEAADAADTLGDSMDLLAAASKSVVKSIGAALAPMLTDLSVTIARCAKSVKDFVGANKEVITTIFKVGVGVTVAGAAFLALGTAISGISSVLGVVVAGFTAFHAAAALVLTPIGAIGIALGALGIAFVKYTNVGGQAIAWLKTQFSGLSTDAKAVFKGIADALKAGDITLAGRVMWAGLNLEWLKGTVGINKIWSDAMVTMKTIFTNASFDIAGGMVDRMSDIEINTISKLARLKTAWGQFFGLAKGGWAIVVGEMKKKMLDLEAIKFRASPGLPFTETGSQVKSREENEKRIQEAKAQIDRETEGTVLKGAFQQDNTAAEAAKRIEQIQRDRIEALKALNDQENAATEERNQKTKTALDESLSELKKAQKQFDALRAQAAGKAQNIKPPAAAQAPGAPAEPEPFTPEGLDRAMSTAKQKARVDIAGSFSAAALAGLGAGTSTRDVAENQLNEQKKTNGQLEKLNRKAQAGQLVFG